MLLAMISPRAWIIETQLPIILILFLDKLHQFFVKFIALIIEEKMAARFKWYKFGIPDTILLRYS